MVMTIQAGASHQYSVSGGYPSLVHAFLFNLSQPRHNAGSNFIECLNVFLLTGF